MDPSRKIIQDNEPIATQFAKFLGGYSKTMGLTLIGIIALAVFLRSSVGVYPYSGNNSYNTSNNNYNESRIIFLILAELIMI